MAKANIKSMADVVIAMRAAGTGEQKLRYIAENLKSDRPESVKALMPTLSELTIAKLCDVLGVPVEAVLPERPKTLGTIDLYVPPETATVQASPEAAKAATQLDELKAKLARAEQANQQRTSQIADLQSAVSVQADQLAQAKAAAEKADADKAPKTDTKPGA